MSAEADYLDRLPRAGNGMDVAEALRLAILDGTLPVGTRLGQPQLARAFGTSRTPIREALQKLHGWGLVDLEANRAALVRGADRSQYSSAFVVWAELTALATELAVTNGSRITKDLRAAVREEWAIIDATSSGVPPNARMGERWMEAQRAFHRALLDGSKSERLQETIGPAVELLRWETIWRTVAGRLYPLRSAAVSHEEVVVLLDRLEGRKAGDCMRRHVMELGDSVLIWFDRTIADGHESH